MLRILSFTLFLLALFALDLYTFQGYKLLIRRWMPSQAGLLYFVYWAIPFALLALILGTLQWSAHPSKSKLMLWSSSLLFGLFIAKFIWLSFIILDDIIRLIKFGSQQTSGTQQSGGVSRSQFIITAGALLAGTIFGTLIFGIANGAHNYTVIQRKLKLKNLPKAFRGFKIVQISDVHAGSFWSREGVQRGIKMILDQKPDALFFTGDLVNNTASEFDDFKDMFADLKAPYGVYSVLGNHDYGDYHKWPDKNGTTKAENLKKLKDHHTDLGWNLLINEHRVIEKGGESLAILGVENWSAHRRFPKYGKLDKAFKGAAHIENKLLLSHDPSHWRAEVLTNFPSIDATFSGHTHGMQFGIDSKYYRWSPVKYQYPEWADLYQENGQYLYVNRGFGYLGYPGRVGFLPEITVFHLERA